MYVFGILFGLIFITQEER